MTKIRSKEKICVFFLKVLCCMATIVNSASQYYDGPNRPYEFGYTIEGNQHRYEKKDENGIIMGEFGFITADGVYHVTVYATDENGNFKIISMKNMKIGLPGENIGARKSPSAESPMLITEKIMPMILKMKPILKAMRRLKPVQSCSSCVIPETQQNDENDDDYAIPGSYDAGDFGQRIPTSSAGGNRNNLPGGVRSPDYNNEISPSPKTIDDSRTRTPQGSQPSTDPDYYEQLLPPDEPRQQQQDQIPPGSDFESDGRNLLNDDDDNKSFGQRQQPPSSGQRNQVSTPSLAGEPPQGKSVGEDSGLLYRFNYTVGYHGHHEQGDYDGVKDGGYHFVGRDGLRRNISYLANEFGYQPYLRLEPADDEDIPKEETEKEAGLKGYEFIWFNQPPSEE